MTCLLCIVVITSSLNASNDPALRILQAYAKIGRMPSVVDNASCLSVLTDTILFARLNPSPSIHTPVVPGDRKTRPMQMAATSHSLVE